METWLRQIGERMSWVWSMFSVWQKQFGFVWSGIREKGFGDQLTCCDDQSTDSLLLVALGI